MYILPSAKTWSIWSMAPPGKSTARWPLSAAKSKPPVTVRPYTLPSPSSSIFWRNPALSSRRAATAACTAERAPDDDVEDGDAAAGLSRLPASAVGQPAPSSAAAAVRGLPSLRMWALRSVALVGARACTEYGAHMAALLGTGLAERG